MACLSRRLKMKLKIVIVDLEVPPGAKKWALRLGIPAAVLLGGGAVAYAAGLVTWSDGQTLSAADLNGNFSYSREGSRRCRVKRTRRPHFMRR
jgi:hypothetical protein